MDLGYDTLVNLSQALRKEFPPPAILFGNFEGAWIAHGKLFPKVPESWDLCSADMYRNVDATKRDGAGWPLAGELYAEHLLPKMAAHQKAVFVPGTFASPATLADDDTAAAAQLQLFLEAALNDTRIAGFSYGALCLLLKPLLRLMMRRLVRTGRGTLAIARVRTMPRVRRRMLSGPKQCRRRWVCCRL